MPPVLLPPRLSGFDVEAEGLPDPELLIGEARERQRRRRIRAAIAVLALGALAAAAYEIARPAGGASTSHSRFTPIVDARSFAGHGRLAFVSRGRLYVLDGTTGRLVRAAGAGAGHPSFSPDGRWLAWVQGTKRFGVARSDGAHPRLGSSHGFPPRWLPGGRLLVGRSLYRIERGTAVRAGAAPAGLVAWSADGSRYVFVTRSVRHGANGSFRGVERIEVSASLAGARTVWYRAPISFTRTAGFRGNAVSQVAVAPGGALLVWLDPMQSASIAADGLTVYELTSPHGYLHRLGVTVGAAVSAAGDKVALGAGAGREAWTNKQVVTCERGRCGTIVTTAAPLTLDPAWSPDGTTLAYVSAAAGPEGSAFDQSALRHWYASRRLWLVRAHGGLSEVPGPAGAAAPQWSADGRSLLFVARDGLWLLPSVAAKPLEIASPLFGSRWPNGHGSVPWPAQFAWWSGR